jgi:hypothetical protein
MVTYNLFNIHFSILFAFYVSGDIDLFGEY